jgi:hypothetical protein
MTLMSFDDCHRPIVRRGFRAPLRPELKGRRPTSDGEGTSLMAWIRRRQERRAARRAARLLLVLDDLAGTRKLPPRRVVRASLGAVR